MNKKSKNLQIDSKKFTQSLSWSIQKIQQPTSLLVLSLAATNSLATSTIIPTTPNLESKTLEYNKIIHQELMIIDSRLSNIDNLIERRRKGLIPIIVQQDENGLDAISQAMLKYPDAATIHVVSHGESGEILLGNSSINEDQLNTKTGSIHQWKNDKVLARPDLIVYGCNVAKGQVGQDFIKKLSAVTGFDVAASTNLTGQSSLGGDWELESNTGWIDASLAWQDTDIIQIQGVLANFTVNSLADSGAGTLRDALDNLVADGDTINFNVTGTITLTTGELTIANDITLTGPGSANLSIDAAGNSRVMTVQNGLDVTISDITITGGRVAGNGGGIRSYASYLAINNAVISDNTSSSSYAGGGINHSYYGSTIKLSNVTMQNNYAGGGNGGAIQAYIYEGSLSITDSTISNNNSYNNGGGISVDSNYSSILLTNVTMNNNSSDYGDGGAVNVNGYSNALRINDSRITNNAASNYDGGGIHFENEYGLVTIDNTTITGNTAGQIGGGISIYIDDYNGDFTIRNNSIINNNSANYGGGIGVYSSSVEKGYANNGFLLIDNVTISGNTASSDGGGLWLYGEEDFIDTTIQNSTISNNYSGYNGGGVFFTNDYGYADLDILSSTISNNTAAYNGGGIQIQHETYGSDVTITDSTISGNRASDGDGGGINVYHEESLDYSPYGSLTITNTQITSNTANGDGGGIASYSDSGYLSDLTIIGGSISNNTATNGSGGGINIDAYNYIRNIAIDSVTIDNNTSYGLGGGVNLEVSNGSIYGSAIIKNSTISNNTSRYGSGGGLSVYTYDGGSPIEVTNSTISGNNVANSGDGGGIQIYNNTTVMLTNSTVTNNTANDGGGIRNNAYLHVNNSIIASNSASTDGQDIFNNNVLTMANSIISDSNYLNGYTDNGGNLLDTDPLLSPLQNNGGATLTHQLTDGSPAIDAGDNALISEAFDQRGTGFPRVLNTTVDMGAVEGGLAAIEAAAVLSSITVVETAGVVTYTINLDSPAPITGVTIDLSFAGTAIGGGVDYTASGAQIVIASGATSGFITFNIIDDGLDETDETIIINIDSITNATVSGSSSATVTILAAIAGPPAIIPTLSSWSTLLLSLLVPAFVMRRFRKQKKVDITYN